MRKVYKDFIIRSWESGDRQVVQDLIASVLAEYRLTCEPEGADIDVWEVEKYYLNNDGEFWVVEQHQNLVGTAAYYPINRGTNAVEIRKMYLQPQVRGLGLGKYLLTQLEQEINRRGFQEIWIETATVLREAVKLYEHHGYEPTTGVETRRCDRIYKKTLP
ncbi:MAG: GNAT family N-acetyltransferase [Limnospira sp. PMC 1291.21]|uniref:GCN5-related N-acetyltransferase n=2 Tax=Limnospira TaxID=2596745 RepID=A0A9P1KL22_9CYAN|nr:MULTISPECIES: GNAT family N-acetyltransferase [Limnospira]EKD09424.1 GCN5-related N-acetyltransferase [Arthrospira platensis C1]MDY7051609.1 GNAT family N-acetyltransferase [Limnospira fusiformis LS22]QJB24780.1 GNAT family N-acetyltransferase [Limnospira fusiformis SAG 85.79]MDT9180294.1 GNAT family N-acetyltransferase [Limnospira sp. PMC 1238.20]MDT9187061.1 GNAT family N-acetyltransferase [Limnospira sp. PMC 894.15]